MEISLNQIPLTDPYSKLCSVRTINQCSGKGIQMVYIDFTI